MVVIISSTSQLQSIKAPPFIKYIINDYLLLFNELESTRHLHQLLMVSSASVNLIGVYWSHAALELDGWFAMTCV